jgi:hypothetical protein
LAAGGLNFLLPKKNNTQMTFLELRTQFKNVEEDWDNRLKALNYEDLEHVWNSKTELHRKGMAWMTEFVGIHIFQHLVYTLDMKVMDWQDKLFYLVTNEERLDLIKMRVEELKTYFEQNQNKSLDPAFYLDTICGVRFPHFVFNDLPEPSQKRIMEKTKNDFNELEISRFVYGEMYEFAELNASIIEFMYIKTLVEEFTFSGNAQKTLDRTVSSNISKNEYPEIFPTINSYLLFNYTLREWKEKGKIGPAIVTKLLEYFKDENRIFQEVKPAHYKNFLKKEHQYTLRKLDDRTAPNDHEISIFKNIEKNFKLKPKPIN